MCLDTVHSDMSWLSKAQWYKFVSFFNFFILLILFAKQIYAFCIVFIIIGNCYSTQH